MRKISLTLVTKLGYLGSFVCLIFGSCAISLAQEHDLNVFENGLKFCEGTVAYQNKILVSNFGGDVLNPLNEDGKGYIMAIENNKVKPFIKCDGNLSAPKGMWVFERHLFIADVKKVVVYDLTELAKKPIIIAFPEEDKFVNDISAVGNLLLVSVTNTGRLYGIDLSNMDALSKATPKLLGTIPGANGIKVYENFIYVASYNPTGVPNGENVIYVSDITKPGEPLKKLIGNLPAGQYDGIALSADGNKLYFSAWATVNNPEPSIYIYDIAKKMEAKVVDLGVKYGGPADITIKNNVLWIPDLVNSKVYRFDL